MRLCEARVCVCVCVRDVASARQCVQPIKHSRKSQECGWRTETAAPGYTRWQSRFLQTMAVSRWQSREAGPNAWTSADFMRQDETGCSYAVVGSRLWICAQASHGQPSEPWRLRPSRAS
ncbi:MAG: hypothetical protein ACPIOQ_49165 [Promethearchaeia archaeon]